MGIMWDNEKQTTVQSQGKSRQRKKTKQNTHARTHTHTHTFLLAFDGTHLTFILCVLGECLFFEILVPFFESTQTCPSPSIRSHIHTIQSWVHNHHLVLTIINEYVGLFCFVAPPLPRLCLLMVFSDAKLKKR